MSTQETEQRKRDTIHCISISKEIWQLAKTSAKEDGRSVSNLLSRLIKNHANKKERRKELAQVG